jgi:hypothetical protein
MAGIDHPRTDAPAKETERLFNRSPVLAKRVQPAAGPAQIEDQTERDAPSINLFPAKPGS